MIILAVPLLFILLIVAAVKAKRAGRSGLEVTLLLLGGTVFIVAVAFGVLAWGFAGFG